MRFQTNETILDEKRPRTLRSAATDAEKKLWHSLRNRQIHGARFRRQHALNDYIADFVTFDAMLIIELDGGQHADQIEYDTKRTTHLVSLGFHVYRCWNGEVFTNLNGVLDTIYHLVERRLKPHPHLNPPLEGEGAVDCSP
jgi:very-short-patch-repair endonuclease